MNRILLLTTIYSLFILSTDASAIQNHPTDSVISRIQSTPVVYPIKFVFFGDSRNSFDSGDPSADSIFAIEREQIDSIHPDFVVHGGDFRQDGYRDEYYDFVARIDSFETNMVTVRGNHELYADEGPAMYDSIFGETDYYFDYGRYRFVVLADCQQDSATGIYGHYIDYLVSEEQLNWLDSILTEADSMRMWEFVFAHVPPYNAGHDTLYCLGDTSYSPEPNYEQSHTEQFSTILSSHRIVAGCWSHQHFYDRSTYMDVPYIISGGAGADLIPAISPSPYGGSFYHFILFELDSTGNTTGYVYKAGEYFPYGEYTFTLTPLKIKRRISTNSIRISYYNDDIILFSNETEKCYINLYDILGRSVMTNVRYDIKSGKNTFDLRDYNLKNGVYFARISGNDFNMMEKIIYIR